MGDILALVAKRLGLGLVTLLVVSVLIFFAVELLPGDIAQAVLGQSATEETLAQLREQLGLERPAFVRYFEWLGGAVTGDFGTSLTDGERVTSENIRAFREYPVPGHVCRGHCGSLCDHTGHHRCPAAQFDFRQGGQRPDAHIDLFA